MLGSQQSPVNITGYALDGAPKLEFDYSGTADRVANTGDFIRVKYENGGGILIDSCDEYRLTELHVHNPGEHTLDGEQFALETHLVHEGQSGKTAVVGILYRLGEENAAIQAIIDSAPGLGEDDAKPSPALEIAHFLPDGNGYYAYMGSLTTPPYTEGVQWFVLSEILKVSKEQVTGIAARTRGATNNRALQPLNGRKIRRYIGN